MPIRDSGNTDTRRPAQKDTEKQPVRHGRRHDAVRRGDGVRLPEMIGTAPQVLKVIPYAVTLLAVIAVGLRSRLLDEVQAAVCPTLPISDPADETVVLAGVAAALRPAADVADGNEP